MIYSLLIIAAIIIIMRRWQTLPADERNKQMKKNLLWLTIGIILILVAAGRAHWLMGVLAGLMAVMGRLLAVARYIPLFRKILGDAGFASAKQQAGQNKAHNVVSAMMTVEEAAAILGIEPDAPETEITTAHKKLMQKVHPDRGGSDALAVQINQAKEVMVDNLA